MAIAHFDSTREARTHLGELFTAAGEGRPATVQRAPELRISVIDGARLVRFFREVHPSGARVVDDEGHGVAILLPGLPIHGDGDTLDEAVDDAIGALRDYAEDWSDHLRHAPNHAGNDMLVQFIAACDDADLRDWLLAG